MQFACNYCDPKGNRQKSVITDIVNYFIASAVHLNYTKQGAWRSTPSPLFCCLRRPDVFFFVLLPVKILDGDCSPLPDRRNDSRFDDESYERGCPMRGDVKEKYSLLPLREEMDVAIGDPKPEICIS